MTHIQAATLTQVAASRSTLSAPEAPSGATRPGLRWLLAPLYCAAILTSMKSFRDNPVIGSPALNRRGLHVWRRRTAARLGAHRRRSLAGLLTDADRAAFERDGFLIKPNFLADAEFRAFRDEIFSLSAPAREGLIGDTLTRLIPLDTQTLRRLPTVRAMLEGSRYRRLLAYVGSFRRRPFLYVQTVFSRFADAEPDVQSYYHTDTFYPTLKSWFYLQDVDEDAAPFAYVRGSHRPTKRHQAWERRVSVTAHAAGDKLTAEGSLRLTEADITRLGYAPAEKFPVAANTLVVADTSGIHRRSTTERATARVSIWAYSRSNPFLPWTRGDVTAIPLVSDYARRAYWVVADRLRERRKTRRVWRWVGIKTPLSPPTDPTEVVKPTSMADQVGVAHAGMTQAH